MLSIGKLAPGPDAASYYLRRVGCPLDYYVGRGEASGVWIGRGAEALQLCGPLAGPDAEQVLRGLLDGVGADGTRLVAPVLRADPRSRLPAADVVTAVRRAADARQVDPRELLAPEGPGLARAWTRAARELELARRRPRWPAPSLPPRPPNGCCGPPAWTRPPRWGSARRPAGSGTGSPGPWLTGRTGSTCGFPGST